MQANGGKICQLIPRYWGNIRQPAPSEGEQVSVLTLIILPSAASPLPTPLQPGSRLAPNYKGLLWGKAFPLQPAAIRKPGKALILCPSGQCSSPQSLTGGPTLGLKDLDSFSTTVPFPTLQKRGSWLPCLVRDQTQGTWSKEWSMGDTAGRGAKGMWQGHGGRLGASHWGPNTSSPATSCVTPTKHFCISGFQ